MIYKGVCDKGFIWNRSNCECECYKFCGFSESLDYKNFKCKKMLLNKWVERSSTEKGTESTEEARLVQINSTECNSVENKCKHNSCTQYIVLFSIFFTTNVGINSYFFIYTGT